MKILKDYAQAAKLIKDGSVGVFPSDTVYGLCAAASNEVASARMYQLKNREKKPGTVIAASIGQLVDLGIKRRYLTAVEQYWPGAVSVIIPVGFSLPYLHQGIHSLAIRIPKDNKLLELINQTGPLITTSANQPGEPPANTINEAVEYFGDKVDFYLDGGDLSGREPSTIIRVVDDAVDVIREGSVSIDKETGRILP